jgi:hypothetical protein
MAYRTPALETRPGMAAHGYFDVRRVAGEILVLDALAPPLAATELWQRLDARPPTAAVVLNPITFGTSM